MIFAAAAPARAIDAVSVRSDAPAIDLTAVLDHQRSDTDRIQVSTAPGTDGIVRRIEVRAREGGQNWVVFALANNTDDQLDRLIVAPHYRIVSSGLLWPDLGLSRSHHHASTGDRPERQESATADIFRITLDPGAVSPSSRNCAPINCRSSICGSPTPTRTRSIRSRSTRAS
jgi:7TMR-DISM extracellular 2.